MSLAVCSSSVISLLEIQGHADVYVLDIPVIIEGSLLLKKKLDIKSVL